MPDDPGLETPVQVVGVRRRGRGRRLAEVVALGGVVVLLAAGGGILPADRPEVAAVSPGPHVSAGGAVAPDVVPVVYLGALRNTRGRAALTDVALTTGCHAAPGHPRATTTSSDCRLLTPVRVPEAFAAQPGATLRIWVSDGTFIPDAADRTAAVTCARLDATGVRVAANPGCDLRMHASNLASVAFSFVTPGIWRLAITGCAVDPTGRTCGVWWARVDTRASA